MVSDLEGQTLDARVALVADDDPDLLIIMDSLLGELGLEIRLCNSGQEAIQNCVERGLPELAILDRYMPIKTGIEVCRWIKGQPKGELVPVMVVTALDSVGEKVKAFEDGVDDYLIKPFHPHEFRARVASLLRIRELTVALSERNEQLQEVQEIMLQQERSVVLSQLAGAAAHQLGQPLTAILLNSHLLKTLSATDERFKKALDSVTSDVRRMAEIIESLRKAAPERTSEYFGGGRILDLGTGPGGTKDR